MPEYDEKDYNKILTQIIGGPGEITSGAVIESGSNYEVNWEIAPNAPTNPDDPDYVAYKVDKVEVNGEVVDLKDNKLNFDDITEDTDVKVYVSPDLYDVTILTYGDGTASSSKTMYKNQNYVDIAANPNTGNAIVKIVVDGEEVEVEADQQTAMFAAFALFALHWILTWLPGIKLRSLGLCNNHFFLAEQSTKLPFYFYSDMFLLGEGRGLKT